MERNVGGADRVMRVVVGTTLVVLASAGILGAWAFVGAVPVMTGLMGWCPAYLPFGMSTCKLPPSAERDGSHKT